MKRYYFIEEELEYDPNGLGEKRNYGRYMVRSVEAKTLRGAKAARSAGKGHLFEEELRNGHFLSWTTGEVVWHY